MVPGGDPESGFSQSLTSRHGLEAVSKPAEMKTNVTLILCQSSRGQAVAPVATLMRLGDSREPACPGEPCSQRTLQIKVLGLRIPKVQCRVSPCKRREVPYSTRAGRGPQSSFTNERLSCDPQGRYAPVPTCKTG